MVMAREKLLEAILQKQEYRCMKARVFAVLGMMTPTTYVLHPTPIAELCQHKTVGATES